MLKKGLTIYEPVGKAGEYAPLAVNLYKGCSHGCRYCYAPSATFKDRETFHRAAPRQDIIKKLLHDAPLARDSYTGLDRTVLLSFTSDPYQPINDTYGLTRQAITILHDHHFNVCILTKGGMRATADFDLLRPGDQFATTLTFLDEEQSLDWEPEAAWPGERLAALAMAHFEGKTTWASLEPVIDPAVTLDIIQTTYTYVDLFKVGKLNYPEKLPEPYRSQVKDIDWSKFANDVTALLEKLDCRFYIKEDLRRYLS